ncbi:MAG: hypothetical protein LBQ80_02360 [Clostridium sp.]|jgi:hypothetical protein|nr:hypothetical protein [Clostridium sp.]
MKMYKKILIAFISIIVILLMLTSCDMFATTEAEPSQLTETSSLGATIFTPTTVPTTPLPTYTPGSVSLLSPEEVKKQYDVTYEMKFRKCYYTIPGWIETDIPDEIVSAKDIREYNDRYFVDNPDAGTDYVMPLKRIIEHFKIPKEEIEKCIEAEKQAYLDLISDGYSIDLNSEEYELPNADIIYTFDDEIINDYYRRE